MWTVSKSTFSGSILQIVWPLVGAQHCALWWLCHHRHRHQVLSWVVTRNIQTVLLPLDVEFVKHLAHQHCCGLCVSACQSDPALINGSMARHIFPVTVVLCEAVVVVLWSMVLPWQHPACIIAGPSLLIILAGIQPPDVGSSRAIVSPASAHPSHLPVN